MQRLLSAIATAAFALSVGALGSADTMATSKPMMKASPMAMMAKPMKCKKGETMVKGYTKKDGTKVAAYCKKAKM